MDIDTHEEIDKWSDFVTKHPFDINSVAALRSQLAQRLHAASHREDCTYVPYSRSPGGDDVEICGVSSDLAESYKRHYRVDVLYGHGLMKVQTALPYPRTLPDRMHGECLDLAVLDKVCTGPVEITGGKTVLSEQDISEAIEIESLDLGTEILPDTDGIGSDVADRVVSQKKQSIREAAARLDAIDVKDRTLILFSMTDVLDYFDTPPFGLTLDSAFGDILPTLPDTVSRLYLTPAGSEWINRSPNK